MKTKETNTTVIISAATNAAQNAAAAALSAVEASKEAAVNASVAAKAAADSATAIAIVATDTSWMKGTLSRVEATLNEMSKAFVTAAQHTEVLKRLDEHEERINKLDSSNIRQTLLLSVGTAILSLLVGLMVWHIVYKG